MCEYDSISTHVIYEYSTYDITDNMKQRLLLTRGCPHDHCIRGAIEIALYTNH
jgi:hypothetical protein